MESVQTLTDKMAAAMSQLCPPNSLLKWDFRGEVGDMVEYDKTMIAILSFNDSQEEIYGNRTQRLTGQLTGQIMVEQLADNDIYMLLDQMQSIIYDYIASLRYTEVGDAMVLQGTCDSVLTQNKGEYWGFILPIEVIVQF